MSSRRQAPVKVPNAPLREAFLASGMTRSEVCERLGWLCTRPNGGLDADSSRLARVLGLRMVGAEYRDTVYLAVAAKIAEALGMDFDDAYEAYIPAVRPRGGLCVECGIALLRPVSDRTCGFCRDELVLFGWVAA